MTSRRIRTIRLLDRGFYPVELPPPFQTRHFSSVKDTLAVPDNYSGSTTFFDGATFRGALRTFGVVNPASYMLLSKYLAEKWPEIGKVFRLSGSSGSRPKFPGLNEEGRAIQSASLASKRVSQRHLASVFPVIVSLDINRFYGSIYTHSIPWAALGKTEAKRRYRAHTLSGHWSDSLDKFARNSNQRQTIGLPIGPDTSRIISELVLSRIDAEIAGAGSGLSTSQIYHNIDDYQIGAYSISDAENAQSCFVRTISRYELRLNDFKTSIDYGLEFTPSNFQRHFDVLRDQTGRNLVEHFFEILYGEVPRHVNTNVVGYALKRFARQLARNREKELVREYLQRLLFAAPHQARWILPLLLGFYRQNGVNSEIRRLVSWGVEVCTRRNDVGSLLWFLYAALFLDIRLNAASSELCFGMSNELVDLMLMHGKSRGLFNFSITRLRKRYRDSDFQSPAWLMLYETERNGWDASPAFQKVGTADDQDSLYDHFLRNNVQFYLPSPESFQVESFSGWNLEQEDFAEEEVAWPDIDFNNNDDWENYD